jgi:hypothetical protein
MIRLPILTSAKLSNQSQKPYIRLELKKGARKPMTVGIAAIAERKYIVTASDRAITAEITSDDCVFKAEPYHKEWSAILSGNDISDIAPILELAKTEFLDKENTLENAVESLGGAFRVCLSKKAENRILGRYSITMREFLENGRKYFRQPDHLAISQEIKYERLDCSFLSSGFDKDGHPHIFKIVEPGLVEYYDKPGFWAIGSGETAAKTLLLYLGQNIESTLAATIYNVCASKFMAEKAPGVGRETWFYIKGFGTDALMSPLFFVEQIRNSWESFGQPRIPEQIIQTINAYLQEGRLLPVDLKKHVEELKTKLSSPT